MNAIRLLAISVLLLAACDADPTGGTQPDVSDEIDAGTDAAWEPDGPSRLDDVFIGGPVVINLCDLEVETGWTHDTFSYGHPDDVPSGQVNEVLQVGGWGDWYVTLIRFPLDGLPMEISSAQLELCVVQDKGFGPTNLWPERLTEPFEIEDDWIRWGEDGPQSVGFTDDPVPGRGVGECVAITITEPLQQMLRSEIENYGFALWPTATDNVWLLFASSRWGQGEVPEWIGGEDAVSSEAWDYITLCPTLTVWPR